jgi:hypothetical protein
MRRVSLPPYAPPCFGCCCVAVLLCCCVAAVVADDASNGCSVAAAVLLLLITREPHRDATVFAAIATGDGAVTAPDDTENTVRRLLHAAVARKRPSNAVKTCVAALLSRAWTRSHSPST